MATLPPGDNPNQALPRGADVTRLVVYGCEPGDSQLERRLGVVTRDDDAQLWQVECHRCGRHGQRRRLQMALAWLTDDVAEDGHWCARDEQGARDAYRNARTPDELEAATDTLARTHAPGPDGPTFPGC